MTENLSPFLFITLWTLFLLELARKRSGVFWFPCGVSGVFSTRD
jgi:hypothetical protein